MKTKTERKTVCLYTRKHADGGRYLAATNTNCARRFAIIDGERWTNRGLVVGDPEISTAEHEARERLTLTPKNETMKPENTHTARPTESAGTGSPRPKEKKTAYVSLAERIRACDTPTAFNRVEAQCARHYEAGTITVSEFGRLDVLLMETRTKAEGITAAEMVEYSNSFRKP